MDDGKHSDIMYAIGEMRGDIKAINDRLDTLSNEIANNAKDIDKIKLVFAKFGGVVLTISTLIAVAWHAIGEWVKAKILVL